MANKRVFKSAPAGKKVPPADTVNRAGGAAYKLGEKAALAQYAATGTFNDTFYQTGESQIAEVMALVPKIPAEFVAKVALYSRDQGRMKDMPALLVTHLMAREDGKALAKSIFPLVIDNSRMLRNVFQILRSGVVGKKSFANMPAKLMQSWFTSRTPEAIFRQSVGNDPSLGDIIKMIHLKKSDSPDREALYCYLLDKEHDEASLPPVMKEYLAFKKDPTTWEGALPKVPFEMLMGLPLTQKQWEALAQQASWTQLRMNLNTFSRHGALKEPGIAKTLAAKLADPDLIEKAKPFPYQLFTTYLHTSTSGEEAIPQVLRTALHTATEIASKNVITYDGQTEIAVDTSGSMSSAVTGTREGATTKMNCVDVAALIACTFLKKNPETKLYPFDTRIHAAHDLDPNDTILTNAAKLRKFGGGGTDCGLVMAHLNKVKSKSKLVIYVSDNESWFDNGRHIGWGRATSLASEWSAYKARVPDAKLVCIDLAMGATTQVGSDPSVLNIGGFSDTVWEVIKTFVEGKPSADHWVDVIEKIQLPAQA